MKGRLAKLLIQLYPRAWRERYGAEFEAFLSEISVGLTETMNIAIAAMRERFRPARNSPEPIQSAVGGVAMEKSAVMQAMSLWEVARKPSAALALSLSVTALGVVLTNAAIYGVAHETDEGAAAHLWQLLVVAQVPVVVVFAIRWLGRATRQALGVLSLFAGAMLANLAAVYFLT